MRPDVTVRGILPGALATVVNVKFCSSEAVELIYRTADGKLQSELLYRHDEARIEVVAEGRPWSFDGDGAAFRLASEALRIRLAHLFDLLLAVHTSRVIPLPHQITAVYEAQTKRLAPDFRFGTRFGGDMTCIVGITDGHRIVIGGDSAGSAPDGPELYSVAIDKVFAVGDYLVGICGSYRAGQIVRWEMEWPAPPEAGAALEPFFVRTVVPAIRQALQNAGGSQTLEGPRGTQFLIGLRGQLFSVGGDYSALQNAQPWVAIGSGRHIAYGALHAMAGLALEPEEKVRRALAAAQSHTANVREPFQVLTAG